MIPPTVRDSNVLRSVIADRVDSSIVPCRLLERMSFWFIGLMIAVLLCALFCLVSIVKWSVLCSDGRNSSEVARIQDLMSSGLCVYEVLDTADTRNLKFIPEERFHYIKEIRQSELWACRLLSHIWVVWRGVRDRTGRGVLEIREPRPASALVYLSRNTPLLTFL